MDYDIEAFNNTFKNGCNGSRFNLYAYVRDVEIGSAKTELLNISSIQLSHPTKKIFSISIRYNGNDNGIEYNNVYLTECYGDFFIGRKHALGFVIICHDENKKIRFHLACDTTDTRDEITDIVQKLMININKSRE